MSKDAEGKNISQDDNNTIKDSERDNHPFHAPPERTGLTPEEAAYVPCKDSRPLPRGIFIAVFAVVLSAFGGGGIWYYRSNILPEKLFYTATRHFHNGEYEEALTQYRRVLRLKPERRDTLFQMGYSYEKLGDDAHAAIAYTRHLENQPKDTEALIRLGNIYLRQGQFEEALAPLQKAAKRSPKNGEVRYSLGKIYEHLGSPQRAAENYGKAVASDVEDPEFLLTASKSLMKLGHYREAIDGFRKAGEFFPSDDKRPLHAVNAAKSMLGWPVNPAEIVVPGKSVGAVAVGMTGEELIALLGEPSVKRESTYPETALWDYGVKSDDRGISVLMRNDAVVRIEAKAEKFRTEDGLGLSNFLEPKYKERFERWTLGTENGGTDYRYIVKGGGLVFYQLDGKRTLAVYEGGSPIGEPKGDWIRD